MDVSREKTDNKNILNPTHRVCSIPPPIQKFLSKPWKFLFILTVSDPSTSIKILPIYLRVSNCAEKAVIVIF